MTSALIASKCNYIYQRTLRGFNVKLATMASRPVVNFITGNKNKLTEVKAILEPAIEVRSQALDLIEVQGTLEEVTIDKCRRAAEAVRWVYPDLSSYFIENKPPN